MSFKIRVCSFGAISARMVTWLSQLYRPQSDRSISFRFGKSEGGLLLMKRVSYKNENSTLSEQ